MTGRRRVTTQASLAVVGLGLLAIPAVAVAVSGAASGDALWTALRIVALEAVTLIFANIMIGAFRPVFNRVIKPRTVHRLHVATGMAGFTLAVAHGLMLLIFGLAGYARSFVWVGPALLVVLVVTMLTATARRRLRASWRWIHRLNYLVFAAGLIHGLALGFDLNTVVWLEIWFFVYAATMVAGLLHRLRTLRSRTRDDRV